jgi:glutaredoxin
MNSRTLAIAAAALALSFASLAQTNVYKWTDKNGKVHFSDVPPPPEVKDSTSKLMGGGGNAAPQAPYATTVAAKRNPVILYSSAKCGELCAQGRALLAKRGVPFTERAADVDPADGEAVKQMTGKLTVPVLRVGEKHVEGFREDLWNSALDAAGYAKTALPGQVTAAAPAAPAAPANAAATPPANTAAAPPASNAEAPRASANDAAK